MRGLARAPILGCYADRGTSVVRKCRAARYTFERTSGICDMASFVWSREPEEAYANPNEYEAQKQFSDGASRVLAWLDARINPPELRYTTSDSSLGKAIWMLRTDVLDGLAETRWLIDVKRHRPAGRLFRDALEGMDLAFALASDPAFAARWLPKWYGNNAPRHGEVRKWLEGFKNPQIAEASRRHYDQLSKFAHRTYRALLKSYSVGAGSCMVHDRWSDDVTLVLPHTIAAYYAILGNLIALFVSQLVETSAISPADEELMWSSCLDPHSVPRRFAADYPPGRDGALKRRLLLTGRPQD